MKIGSIELGEMPLFLAPMEDVSYRSFRQICKKYGADVVTTEFVSSEALLKNSQKTKEKMQLFDVDRPAGIQIYGYDINSMIATAKAAEEMQPDFIDINYGCPMKKIVKKGACSGLLRDLPKMQAMTDAIIKSVSLPVTAKTRLGWTSDSIVIEEVAQRLQDVGIQALTVHGRTREQLYTGQADWQQIAKIKNNVHIHIPIIGNGDINSPEKARKFQQESGVDGLMIGRGAIGHPWLFREIKHYLTTGELLPAPAIHEIIDRLREQLQMTFEWQQNERTAILMMRRHFALSFPGLDDFRPLRIQLLRAETLDEVHLILERINERYGFQSVDYNKARE